MVTRALLFCSEEEDHDDPVPLEENEEEEELPPPPSKREKRRGQCIVPVSTLVATSIPIRGHRPASPPVRETDLENASEYDPFKPTHFPINSQNPGLSDQVRELHAGATYLDYYQLLFAVALVEFFCHQSNLFYEYNLLATLTKIPPLSLVEEAYL